MYTLEEILHAIDEYFGDTSRPASETRDGLEEISSNCEMKIGALAEDEGDDEE